MRTFVLVKMVVPGWHCWAQAPDSVGYLRHPHRHLFTFRVQLEVTDDDRQVEFHLLRARMVQLIEQWPAAQWAADGYDFGGNSCEMLARWMLGVLLDPSQRGAVEVHEDDENGARVDRL